MGSVLFAWCCWSLHIWEIITKSTAIPRPWASSGSCDFIKWYGILRWWPVRVCLFNLQAILLMCKASCILLKRYDSSAMYIRVKENVAMWIPSRSALDLAIIIMLCTVCGSVGVGLMGLCCQNFDTGSGSEYDRPYMAVAFTNRIDGKFDARYSLFIRSGSLSRWLFHTFRVANLFFPCIRSAAASASSAQM